MNTRYLNQIENIKLALLKLNEIILSAWLLSEPYNLLF
jgi:hypothetical protein